MKILLASLPASAPAACGAGRFGLRRSAPLCVAQALSLCMAFEIREEPVNL